jgi:hypothetical protein
MTLASVDLPDGKISEVCFQEVCPAPSAKIFLFSSRANHLLNLRIPSREREALAIVTDVGAGSGGRECCD